VYHFILDKMVDTRPGSEWFWQTDKYGTPAHKPIVEPWKVIAETAGFLIAPRGWEHVSDVSNVHLPMVLLRMMTVRCIFIMPPVIRACTLLPRPLASFWTLHSKTPQTLGLPLPGDYGQVPAKLWYLHKV